MKMKMTFLKIQKSPSAIAFAEKTSSICEMTKEQHCKLLCTYITKFCRSFIQHCIKYARIRVLSVNSCIGTECSMLPLYGEIRFRENAYSGIYFLKPTSDYIVIMDFLRIPMANKWKEQGKTLWTCSKVLFLTSRFRRTYK